LKRHTWVSFNCIIYTCLKRIISRYHTVAGGGVTDKLFVTDFTPLTPLAASSAAVFVDSSFTSPESVTTPSFTLVETVERLAFAAIALSTSVLISASFGFELQDVVATNKKSTEPQTLA
jgi:hypothetical protein